jgi:predicted aspartyl protease
MEAFSVKVRVWNPALPEKIEEFDARVDPHSTFSLISRERLERLEIAPSRKMSFYLKRGYILEEDMASVYLEVDGRPVGDVVVMAYPSEEVIGAHTLNGLGMVADLTQKKLVPTVMWALSSIAAPEIREKDSGSLGQKLRARS